MATITGINQVWSDQKTLENEHLIGTSDDDVITGSRGDDGLHGLAGRDIFHFNVGDGDDHIGDFTQDEDHIRLEGFTKANGDMFGFDDLSITVNQQGDTRIHLTPYENGAAIESNIYLQNFDGTLTADDFIFIA